MDDLHYLQSKRASNVKPFRSKRVEEKQKQELISFDLSDSDCASDQDSLSEAEAKGAFDSDSDEEEEDIVEENVELKNTESKESCRILPSASEVLEDFGEISNLREVTDLFTEDSFENDLNVGWTRDVNRAFKNHKRDYYNEKMKYKNISKEQLRDQAEGYVRAIQWNLHYYYHGCCSWNWYYPHHYAPYISDVVDFSEMKLDFELSEPFHPFEQLLAVLPAASASCLPVPFQELMLDEASPIYDFYPRDFLTDLNGKKNDWEAVVLIPFIDEKRLLAAMATRQHRLTEEERSRNSHGPHLLFTTDLDHPKCIHSPLSGIFDDIPKSFAKKEEISMNEFRIKRELIVHGLLSGVKLDVFFPGFPTMKTIAHTSALRQADICVFRHPTLKKSIIITITERPEFSKDISLIAEDLLGKEVCVEWPTLKKGLVHEIWSKEGRWYLNSDDKIVFEEFTASQQKDYEDRCNRVWKREFKRYGIDVGKRKAIVFVRTLLGVSYVVQNKKLVATQQWANEHEAKMHSLPLVVQNVLEDSCKDGRINSVEDAFPIGCTAFFFSTTTKFYGYRVEVESNEIPKNQSMLKVNCAIPIHEVDLTHLSSNLKRYSLSWLHVGEVARRSRLSRNIVNRITGYVPLSLSHSTGNSSRQGCDEIMNIGIDIKNNKKNLAIPDYARRNEEGWEYSLNTVRIIKEYRERFPEVFRHLEHPTKPNEAYRAEHIWNVPDQKAKRLRELCDFLKSIPSASVSMESADGVYLDSGIVQQIERTVALTPTTWKNKHLGVKPYMLFRHELHTGKTMPDAETEFELFDRVICVRPLRGAPFAKIGTVVGVIGSDEGRTIEVLFDECYLGGKTIRGSKKSGCRLPAYALIDITHGKRVRKEVDVPKTARAIISEELTFWGPNFYHPSVRKPVKMSVNKEILSAPMEAAVGLRKIKLLKKEPTVMTNKSSACFATLFDKQKPACLLEEVVTVSVKKETEDTEEKIAESFQSLSVSTASENNIASPQKFVAEQGLSKETAKETPAAGAFGEFKKDGRGSEKRFEELLLKLQHASEHKAQRNPKVPSSLDLVRSVHDGTVEKQAEEQLDSTISSSTAIAKQSTVATPKVVSDGCSEASTETVLQIIQAPPTYFPKNCLYGLPEPCFAPRPKMQSKFLKNFSYKAQRQKFCDPRFSPHYLNFMPRNQSELLVSTTAHSLASTPVPRDASMFYRKRNPNNWGCPPPLFPFPRAVPAFPQQSAGRHIVGLQQPRLTVPTNMTPTQVMRKKLSVLTQVSGTSEPSTSGVKETEEIETSSLESRNGGISSSVSKDPVNALRAVAPENDNCEKKLHGGFVNKHRDSQNTEKQKFDCIPDDLDSSLPDFESLPELKISDEQVAVGGSASVCSNGDSQQISAAASETSLCTAVSEKTSQFLAIADKSVISECQKKPFRQRKSRIAAKFN